MAGYLHPWMKHAQRFTLKSCIGIFANSADIRHPHKNPKSVLCALDASSNGRGDQQTAR